MIRLFLNLVACVALALGAISCSGAGKRLAKEEIKLRKENKLREIDEGEWKKDIAFFKKLLKNFDRLSDDEKDKYCGMMAEYELANEMRERAYYVVSLKLMTATLEVMNGERQDKIWKKKRELQEKREEEEYERRMRDPEEKKLEQMLNDAKQVGLVLAMYCDDHDGNLPVGLDDDDLIKYGFLCVDKKRAEQFRMLDLPQKITEIKNPSETVMFVSKKGIRGRFVVGYADGHCVILQESDLPK